MTTSKRLSDLILFFSFIFTAFCPPAVAGEDDGESVYGYHGIYGCGCFVHCTCFSHYIGPFRQGCEWLQNGAFPIETKNHPKRPEDVVWHEFIKGILTANKKIHFLECNSEKLRQLLKFYSGNDLCMLDEYIDCIESFKQFYEKNCKEQVFLMNKWYPTNKDAPLRMGKINDIYDQINSAHQILDEIPTRLIPLYKNILSNCYHTKEVYNMAFYYNSALIKFIEGKWEDFALEAERLIQLTEINNKKHVFSSEFYHKYGESQILVGNYHDAIKALSIAITKNPENKKYYFQRAIAYFEIGDFDQAIVDYLFSEKSKQIINRPKISIEFQKSVLKGLIEGGEEAIVDFFPSLWDSVYGIGHTLWIFAEHPVDTTINFYNCCYDLAEVAAEHFRDFDWETLEECANEVKLLCEKFDSLTDAEQGKLIGYCIGKYGIDIFAGGVAIKSVSALKNLKDANRLCNLESMTMSTINKETIVKLSGEYAVQRNLYFKTVKYNYHSHNKHILGHNDYRGNRSIWTHQDPEGLLRRHAGKGNPERGYPGVPGYKETVDFGETIGIWISEDGVNKLLTSRGTIHYGQKGAHIVPVKPHPK